MPVAATLSLVARSDSTFERRGVLWVGKCLICNGPIAFDANTGEGATLEHIRARSRGGDDSLENLAVVHARCNSEKGIRWDNRKRRGDADYEPFIARLAERRLRRFRDPGRSENGRPGRCWFVFEPRLMDPVRVGVILAEALATPLPPHSFKEF